MNYPTYDPPGPGAQLLGASLLQERDHWHGEYMKTSAVAEKALRELAESRAENARLRQTVEALRNDKEVPF